MKWNHSAKLRAFIMLFCFFAVFGFNDQARGQGPGQKEGSSLGLFFTYPIKFFQKVISPVDGDRCGLYPSCSTYAAQSFKKNGPIVGWIMTADRLLRCGHDEKGVGAPVRSNGHLLTYDPVGNNDYWWNKEEK